FTSRSIGEALSDDANKRVICALLIADAYCHAVVIAKVKLRQIAMQVLFLAVLIHAAHAALEDRKHILDGVAVDRHAVLVPDVLAAGMTHGAVRSRVTGYITVETAFV